MSGARAEARVYLVDDNDGFRDSTAWLLETAGFEVVAFASGPEFVEAYGGDRQGAEPECLVSDMRMPQQSGLQLQEELRRRGIVLPMVFVTAHGDVQLAVEALRKGAANFLEKHYREEALLDALRATLANAPNNGTDGAVREFNATISYTTPTVCDRNINRHAKSISVHVTNSSP